MWFTNLLTNGGGGTTVLMLSVAIFAGLLLGKIKVKGITLGITWVLFVGLQVGPGFFRSFKKGGLAMNLMAVVNVALGVGITIIIAKLANQELTDMAGVYTGAITNTPGLSAAQQAVGDLGLEGAADRLAAGYAVAYPLAVVGMIVSCLLLRWFSDNGSDHQERRHSPHPNLRYHCFGHNAWLYSYSRGHESPR